MRVRVFSKKLLTCGGVHFGVQFEALGSEGWTPVVTGSTRDVGPAPSGEVAAARGDGSVANLVLSIRTWGCVDIGTSVH